MIFSALKNNTVHMLNRKREGHSENNPHTRASRSLTFIFTGKPQHVTFKYGESLCLI